MSGCRRSLAAGGTFFFTVNIADRKSCLLIEEIKRLRHAFEIARTRYPFRTIAFVCCRIIFMPYGGFRQTMRNLAYAGA